MLIIRDEPRIIIDKHVPLDVRKMLANKIFDAYKWASLLQQNTMQFLTKRGEKRLLPEMKNVSIEFFLMQASKNREIPFDYRIATNTNGSHPYLELYNADTLIHINQVQRKNSCARKAIFRDRLFKPVQSYFIFEELDEINYDEKQYFQLNHGYQTETPQFVTLGIPNNTYKFDTSISILEEYTAIEGRHPKSKIEKIDGDFFNAFESFVEGDESIEKGRNKKISG